MPHVNRALPEEIKHASHKSVSFLEHVQASQHLPSAEIARDVTHEQVVFSPDPIVNSSVNSSFPAQLNDKSSTPVSFIFRAGIRGGYLVRRPGQAFFLCTPDSNRPNFQRSERSKVCPGHRSRVVPTQVLHSFARVKDYGFFSGLNQVFIPTKREKHISFFGSNMRNV